MLSLVLCTFVLIQGLIFLSSIFIFSKYIPNFKTIKYALFNGLLFLFLPEIILNYMKSNPWGLSLNDMLYIALSIVVAAILFSIIVIYSILVNKITLQKNQ